ICADDQSGRRGFLLGRCFTCSFTSRLFGSYGFLCILSGVRNVVGKFRNSISAFGSFLLKLGNQFGSKVAETAVQATQLTKQVLGIAIVTLTQALHAVFTSFCFEFLSILKRLGSQLLLLLFSGIDAFLNDVLKLFLVGFQLTHNNSPWFVDSVRPHNRILLGSLQ